MAREFVLFVLEGGSTATPYCTPVAPAATANIWTTAATTGVPSTASGANNYAAFYARLDGGDSFTVRPRAVMVSVPYGGGVAIDAFTVSDKQLVQGTYKTKMYAGAFGQFLLQWGMQQVNSLGYVGIGGVSTGWQYGSGGAAAGNLPSVCAFHAIERADGTYKQRLYYGLRVQSMQFTLSEGSTIGDLTMSLVGAYAAGNPFTYLNYTDPTLQTFAVPATVPIFNTGVTASTWCAPSTQNYPITPWLFVDTSNSAGGGAAGSVTIGAGAGTARTAFQSLSMSCTNKIMTRMWANRFTQVSQFVGRTMTIAVQNYYVTTPDDRTQYESVASQLATIVLGDGTHSVTFTMNTNNIISTLEDQLPLEDIYTQTITLTSQFDPAFLQTDQSLAADFQLAFVE